MRKSNFALRLRPSLLDAARKLAETEGVALNQFINAAVAEKVSALQSERYFAARAARGNPGRAKAILAKAGQRAKPRPADRWNADEPSQSAGCLAESRRQWCDRNKASGDKPMTGAELQAWRIRMGWTHKQAAGALGVKVETFRNWLYGVRPVSKTAERLTAALQRERATNSR